MTDLARLGIELDSREVKTGVAELDKLTAAGAKAEKAVDKLGDQAAASGRQLKGAGAAAAEMASEAQRAARATSGLSSGVEGAGKASSLAAHHVQNLAFQANDLFVGLASGQKPMTVFMQQGAQIAQIMAQAQIGVGGLAKQVGMMGVNFARAHPVLMAVAAAAGLAFGAFQQFQGEIEKSGELEKYANGLGLTKKEMKDLEGVGITAGDVFKGLYKTLDQYLGLTEVFTKVKNVAVGAFNLMLEAAKVAAAGFYAGWVGGARALGDIFRSLPALVGEGVIASANLAISAVETLINKALKGIRTVVVATNPLLAAANMAGLVPDAPEVAFGRIGNPYAGTGSRVYNAAMGEYVGAYNEALGGMSKFGADLRANIIGSAEDRLANSAAEIIEKRTTPRARDAARKGGKATADEWGKLLIDGLGKFDPEIQKRMQGIAAQTASDIADMRSASEAAFEQTYKGLNRAVEANLEWNDQLRDTIGYLNQIGGFGSTLADIGGVFYGLKTGDFGGVGGPLGAVAQTFKTAFPDFSEKIVTGFDKVLKGVFGANGSFTNMLQGAGTGTAMGSLLFGNNKGAQIGGAIGGSIGQLVGGPIGNLVGSIIGSTLGKLLGGGAKYGSAVVGPNGVVVGGNNDNSKGAATGAGGAVSSAIEQIAQALGGTVGNYAVSIGETDGKWRISTTGRSGELKSKYSDVQVFGKGDAAAEAALKAAIADAIKDGAIQGVSAAVGRLLQGGGDIDKQVQKAQLFQGVFSELKAQTDPLGAALDGVAKQFDALRKIFDEAGASTEEYASLEQLLGIKRQEAIDAARQANVDKISDQFTLQIRALELLGKGEAALAASRLLELAGMKDTLKPIQEMIYQLEDAQAVMSQFKPLADDLRAYRKELVGTSSVASYGAARALFASTAASAAMGDAAALGNLRGVSDSYLASAKANARSGLDYNRARGQVLAAVDQGIFAADAKVDYAQATIDAIDNSAQIMQSMREELRSLGEQTAANTAFTANLLKRLDGPDGLIVSNSDGTPLQVEIVT